MAPRIFFRFDILIFIYFFKYKTIETHVRAFLSLNISAVGSVYWVCNRFQNEIICSYILKEFWRNLTFELDWIFVCFGHFLTRAGRPTFNDNSGDFWHYISSKKYAFWLIFECAKAKPARKSLDSTE